MDFYVKVVPAAEYDNFISERETATATAAGAPALTAGTTTGSGQ